MKSLLFGFVVEHYVKLILHSIAMGSLVIASWAQVNDPIKINVTEKGGIFCNT